jgi:succinate dehydrogenase flavin-adding protein (antitoxin of CptAB toxin-antitoxin module)
MLYTVRKIVERRLGNLFIVRRLDLSAPGTKALAFYSSVDIAPTKLLWSLKLPHEYAKILALYFNSTINLLQTLLFRAETRGAFIELSEYILNDFLVPDPSKLTLREKKHFNDIFDKIKDEDLPDILYQLKQRYPPRMEVDKAFLKWLGFKGDVECALEKLYKSLAHEIETLRRLMAEGSSNPDLGDVADV